MSSDKICKTVRQYNKVPISKEDMGKLQDIAIDYSKVKNYVYDRFGGIGSLSKLYPGYTIQNEMTATDLRKILGLPSVYFYLAIFEALADIKGQWNRTKSKLLLLIGTNDNFTSEEKHYLRFVLKVNNAFSAILNQKPMELSQEIQKKYEEVAIGINKERLHRYLCRQVRKYHVKQHTDGAKGFAITERAYRYGNHGIYLSTKQNRKRIFVPLTDNNQYKSQLYIKLYPDRESIEIMVPVYMEPRSFEEYTNQIGISIGMFTMLTTNDGHCYGKEFGKYQTYYSEWIRNQTISYSCNRGDNPGRRKYYAKKKKLEEQLHAYINQELNLFFRQEKPQTIYMAKLPEPQKSGAVPKINNQVTMWQRGYIRSRLIQKSREKSVEVVEVLGKDISRECSQCREMGSQKDGIFICERCGYSADKKLNTAQNVWKRGVEGRIIRTTVWMNAGSKPGFYRKDQTEGS
ncbi:MAG: transposase [Lachnospiraceae bacterium]|nr:transposase [Lachnospiraceae bacterium]